MKVIIAGPRDYYPDLEVVSRAVHESGFDVTEVVSGGATGVDTCGYDWSSMRGPGTPVVFNADWEEAERLTGNRRAAGPIRNRKMAKYADALIVIKRPGKRTRGTSDMLEKAAEAGLPMYVYEVYEGALF